MPLFSSTEDEQSIAINQELWLIETNILKFIERTANSIISSEKDNNFDYQTILEQFKRLFTLRRFSEILNSAKYLIIDNAAIHTKAEIDINMFLKGINKTNPVEF